MGTGNNYNQTSVAVTSTPAVAIAANTNRTALILFNTGTTPVLVGIGTAVISIDAGNHLAFTDDDAPLNAITASTASTGTLVIWEA